MAAQRAGGQEAEPEEDEVEIEAYGKRDEQPPKAKKYVVRVDKTKHTFDRPLLTGRQVLEKARLTPVDRYRLFQKLHGGRMEEVAYDRQVDLGAKGVERFTTIDVKETEG